MLYSIKCLCTINEAEIYLFLYFQSLFNHSSRVECIFPAQYSSAISGLILFPTCIMMILKSILIISLRKLSIMCYSLSVIPGFFWQCYKYAHKMFFIKQFGLLFFFFFFFVFFFVKHGIKKFWSTSNYSIIVDNHKKKYKRYEFFGTYILLF